MKLLPIIPIHYPAKGKGEYPNLSGRSSYLDLIPNLPNLFASNCQEGRINNQILGEKV